MSAIRVENLGKSYQIRHQVNRGGYRTLRESLAESFAAAWQKTNKRSSLSEREEFWAIRDLNFDIEQGDVVGIIGRNGAGKSTLLKILARITKPTTGRCIINGRVGSLLEVGTGFHPELTGRENIYMNGAILGMSRHEVKRNFDAIVEFAEVEKFLDTPVKRYSSGMYVRLAFAVAAHLEPEILIVDEVLAVGDASFQKKCLGKMRDVSKTSGRTVIFVSHNSNALSSLCDQGIVLEKGSVRFNGPISSALLEYSRLNGTMSNEKIIIADDKITLTNYSVEGTDGQITSATDLLIRFRIRNNSEQLNDFEIDCAVRSADGTSVIHLRSKWIVPSIKLSAASETEFVFRVRTPRLSPGDYSLVIYAQSEKKPLLWVEDCAPFRIDPAVDFGCIEVFDGLKSIVIAPFDLNISSGAT